MKAAIATGLNMKNPLIYANITVRTEVRKNKTLSLADEKDGTMLMVVLTPEVEKILKELIG